MSETKQAESGFPGNYRIGILGGTFNPVHMGHLIMAEKVVKYHQLSKVLFIPANLLPHKYVEEPVDANHRYNMVKQAVMDNKAFEASGLEIKRGGKSYTIDTVREILKLYPTLTGCEIFLIMGADSLNELDLWRDIKDLSELCRFVIVNRPGYLTCVPHSLAETIGNDKALDIESLKIEIAPVGISSTDIRKKLKVGHSVKGLIPPCVEDYIREHSLYTT